MPMLPLLLPLLGEGGGIVGQDMKEEDGQGGKDEEEGGSCQNVQNDGRIVHRVTSAQLA